MKKQDYKKGIAALTAIVVTGLLLTIAVSMGNIMTKEIRLSQAVRQSHIAFYMADQGYECALYWDVRFNAFDPAGGTAITCADNLNIVTNSQRVDDDTALDTNSVIGGANVSVFTIYEGATVGNGPCAVVTVNKAPGGGYISEVESRGYNTCNTSRENRTERAVRARY